MILFVCDFNFWICIKTPIFASDIVDIILYKTKIKFLSWKGDYIKLIFPNIEHKKLIYIFCSLFSSTIVLKYGFFCSKINITKLTI